MHLKFLKEDLLKDKPGANTVAIPAPTVCVGAAGLKCPKVGHGVSVYPGIESGLDALVMAWRPRRWAHRGRRGPDPLVQNPRDSL